MSFSLLQYNTFGLNAQAKEAFFFDDVAKLSELQHQYLSYAPHVLVIGGGSNILFTDDFPGLVVIHRLKGRKLVEEDAQNVYLEVAAGENWHDTVMFAVENNWGGIENLSLIPGCAGAAPIQNIGAYGVEIKDVLHEVKAWEWATASFKTFQPEECQFGYRDSIFKQQKGQYLILSITLKLSKNPVKFNIAYGDIRQTLQDMEVWQPSVKTISEAVVSIRKKKLPDPAILGNAGSFFKNPMITFEQAHSLKESYPLIPLYPQESGVKVAAGWLIEQCGWKGKVCGNTGNHAQQALVIVNYGGATGKEIKAHAMAVQASVNEKFGIELEPEVNFIPG